jgi:class 3 adenylate cyclase
MNFTSKLKKLAIARIMKFPESEQFFAWAATFGLIGAFICFFFLIFLFFSLKVYPMALVNIVCCALVLISYLLYFFRRAVQLSALFIIFPTTLHALLAVYFVGWDAGLQYWLIFDTIIIFMVSSIHIQRYVYILWIPVGYIAFIFCYLFSRSHTPIYELNSTVLLCLNISNIVAVFALLQVIFFVLTKFSENATNEAMRQRDRADSLLLNILPRHVAARLKDGGGIIADAIPEASVMFADIVGFTTLSTRYTPHQIVDLLNDLFSRFDEHLDRLGIEKIKTIGDSYMAVAGLDNHGGDHAQSCVRYSFALFESLAQFNLDRGMDLQIRIGIDSGPLVAGVIGRRKFIYDLWGDTVNTASRMESNGTSGVVQITERTYERIKRDFTCISRGSISVKGKGEMQVWCVQQPQTV